MILGDRNGRARPFLMERTFADAVNCHGFIGSLLPPLFPSVQILSLCPLWSCCVGLYLGYIPFKDVPPVPLSLFLFGHGIELTRPNPPPRLAGGAEMIDSWYLDQLSAPSI